MEKNVIYHGITFFWKMFQLNCCFLMSNILLISTVFVIRLTWITIPIYLIGVLFSIPSFQAVLLSIKRLRNLKDDTSLISLYFSCYKELFKESCVLASGYIFLFTILLVNLYVVTILYHQEILIPLYILLIVLLAVHFIFTLIIRINLIISIKDTFKLSCHFMIKYPAYAVGIIGVCFVAYVIFSVIPQVSILLLFPIIGKILLKFTEKLFQKNYLLA